MGQKVNPHGLRVGINSPWNSVWYAGKKDFGKCIKEDNEIRKYLKKNYYDAAISNINIERAASNIKIDIYCGRVGVARRSRRQEERHRRHQRRYTQDSRTRQDLQRQRARSQEHGPQRPARGGEHSDSARKEDSFPQSDEIRYGKSDESGRQRYQNDGFRTSRRRRNSEKRKLPRGFHSSSDASRGHRLRLCRSTYHLRYHRRQNVDIQG